MDHFLDRVLEKPSYGYLRDSKLYVPTHKEIIKLFFNRYNIFKSKKNWLTFCSWNITFFLTIPFFAFFFKYFSWSLLPLGFIYGMVLMGSHGTLYLHRYCSHRGFRFRNPFFRFIVKNLVVKVIPEEIYAVSHLVHHKYSEKPGDPYNVNGGWLYCFLACANHQPISTNLNEKDYQVLAKFMQAAGLKTNTYLKYKKFGSLVTPLNFLLNYGLNWLFWYGAFYLLGGHALATCIFGWVGVWAFGVRTFNFDGHGRGKDKRQEGIDFLKADKSINQIWPGYVAGEWHNNHHLYPNGARSGFLPYQLDLPWIFIYSCFKLGIITQYHDPKPRFLKEHYNPYLKNNQELKDNMATS